MNFIKKNYKYLLIFILFLGLFIFYFYSNCTFDVMWNYSFSHAIRNGEVPYRDFNLISTPLYSFLMSSLLFIKDDMYMFIMEQSILATALFYILFKLFGKKGWLLLPILSFPLFYQFNGTYNFLALFMIVFLIYLEKKKSNDYLMGFFLGLLILSKQTIGLPVCFFICFYLRDFRKILKRVVGCFIPCFIFLIYLIFTKSLYAFINLCFLGLFDFSKGNGSGISAYMIISLIMFLYTIYKCFKEKNNYLYFYSLGAFFFACPLFDYYHLGLYAGIFSLCFIDKLKMNNNYIRNLSLILFVIILGFNFLLTKDKFKNLTVLGRDHFQYYILKSSEKNWITENIDAYSKYPKAIMLDEISVFYDLTTNKKITYFDVLLRGNYGYNGTSMMIKKISKMHKQVFFIDRYKYKICSDVNQFDKDIVKYTIKHSKKIGKVNNYDIYYKE